MVLSHPALVIRVREGGDTQQVDGESRPHGEEPRQGRQHHRRSARVDRGLSTWHTPVAAEEAAHRPRQQGAGMPPCPGSLFPTMKQHTCAHTSSRSQEHHPGKLRQKVCAETGSHTSEEEAKSFMRKHKHPQLEPVAGGALPLCHRPHPFPNYAAHTARFYDRVSRGCRHLRQRTAPTVCLHCDDKRGACSSSSTRCRTEFS